MQYKPTSTNLFQLATKELGSLAPTEHEGDDWRRTPGHMAEHLEPHDWQFYPHLEVMNEKIVENVNRGGRMIMEIPVRHGKSEITNIWTPIWYLEQFPRKQIILASYEQTWVTNKFGRRARNLITRHRKQLSIRLSKDLTGGAEWETTKGGGMRCTGVGGPLIGQGADLLIIDDPFKNFEEANSQLFRDKVWDWWENTAESRIMPGGAVFLLMARWHPDDIVGRIKSGEWADSSAWTVLNMPALCVNPDEDPLGRKEDEPLWPEQWTKEHLLKIKKGGVKGGGAKRWASQYQQNPRADEGNTFERHWFEIVDDYPKEAKPIRVWDLAGTKKSQGTDPDYTVGIKMAQKDGIFYIIDVIRFRGTPGKVKSRVRQTAQLDGRSIKIHMQEDPGQAGKDQAETYQRDTLRGFAVYFRKPTGDKETKADPLSAAAEAGNVKIVAAPWNETWLQEAEGFPNGTHDDMIDAASEGHAILSQDDIPVERNVPKVTRQVPNYWKGGRISTNKRVHRSF